MELFNYGVVRARVQRETDTEEETLVQPDELVDYANKGIDMVEAEILKVDEDYYLNFFDLTLIIGQANYALPTDIYANKIRAVIYRDNQTIYPVSRIRRRRKFLKIAEADQFGIGTTDLSYYIQNRTTGTPEIVFSPPPNVAGAFPRIWYIRAATRIPLVTAGNQAASDAINVDVLEFTSVVEAHMKMKIMDKEGDPRFDTAAVAAEVEKNRMIQTLTDMTPDDDNEVEQDLDIYREHS